MRLLRISDAISSALQEWYSGKLRRFNEFVHRTRINSDQSILIPKQILKVYWKLQTAIAARFHASVSILRPRSYLSVINSNYENYLFIYTDFISPRQF